MLFERQATRKPDYYGWTNDYMKAIWEGQWTADEFNFRADTKQFRQDLSETERRVVVRSLFTISHIEMAVKSFWAEVGNHLPHPSIKDLGYVMANSEVIHNIAYEKLLVVLGLTDDFEENLKVPVIEGRVKYLNKYLERVYEDDRRQYIYAISLFTLFVESVSLFGQFFIVMNFNQKRALLPDVAQQIQYTQLEESLHGQVGIKLINTLREEYPELFDEEIMARIQAECLESLCHEDRVIDWILEGAEIEGSSPEVVKTFVRHQMIDAMQQIGIEYSGPPLDEDLLAESLWFRESILAERMTDFFEKNPVGYSKGKGIDVADLF